MVFPRMVPRQSSCPLRGVSGMLGGIQRGLRMEGLHPATSFVVRFSQNDLARCHRDATWMKVLARSFSPECLRNKNDPKLPIPRVAAAAQQLDTQRVVRRSPSLTCSNQLCRRMRPEQHGIATFNKHHAVHELAVDEHRVKELGEGWCE